MFHYRFFSNFLSRKGKKMKRSFTLIELLVVVPYLGGTPEEGDMLGNCAPTGLFFCPSATPQAAKVAEAWHSTYGALADLSSHKLSSVSQPSRLLMLTNYGKDAAWGTGDNYMDYPARARIHSQKPHHTATNPHGTNGIFGMTDGHVESKSYLQFASPTVAGGNAELLMPPYSSWCFALVNETGQIP